MRRRAEYSKNAGMTLVELMVAVTILAIIVVPLLHALATSAQVGLKARRNLRITTAVQDLMEGLKAESIESLSCSFNYPDDDVEHAVTSSDKFKNFHVVAAEMIRDDGGDINSDNVYELSAVFDEDDTSDDYGSVVSLSKVDSTNASTLLEAGRYNFVAHSDKADKAHYKKYCFGIQNLQIENGDDPAFVVDALIKVDGSDYTSDGAHKKTSSDGSAKALLNEHGRISYGALNEKRDAFFIQDADLGRLTAQEFNVAYGSWVSVDCTAKDLSQKFIVTVTNETAKSHDTEKAAGDADWITVKCKIVYTSSSAFKIPAEHKNYDASNPDQPYTMSYEYTIFDNKLTGYPPDNIFLCYYPGYGAPSADEIVYVNPYKVASVLHLIKQEGKNNGTLKLDEMSYTCKVSINEGNGAKEDAPGDIHDKKDSVTQVRTNLDSNMYKIYDASTPERVYQGKYYYNNAPFTRNFDKPEDCGIYTLGGERKTSDSMYDVTIIIYEKDTLGAAIADGTSISNNKVLFTLKGSMN